jgi:hypothetical protein
LIEPKKSLPVGRGFQLGLNSIIFTDRGLLTFDELDNTDKLLGLNRRGRLEWSDISIEPSKNHLYRILTDSNDAYIGANNGIYTLEGVRLISSLSNADILETVNCSKVSDHYNKLENKNVVTKIDNFILTKEFAYLLGICFFAKTNNIRVLLTDFNPEKIYDLCKVLDEILTENKIWHKIQLVNRGTRIRIESKTLVNILKIRDNQIPSYIRQSNLETCIYFIKGVLESIIRIENSSDLPYYFNTTFKTSLCRRFILNILQIINIMPIKSYKFNPGAGRSYIKTHFSEQDIKQLNLNYFWAGPCEKNESRYIFPHTPYSRIRFISKYYLDSYSVKSSLNHWSLITDSIAIHPSSV